MLTQTKFGFFGGGAMAEALITGIIKNGLVPSEQVCVSDINEQRLHDLEKRFQVLTTTDSKKLVAEADMLFLTVKPQVIESVFPVIKAMVRPKTVIVSIVAGLTLSRIETVLPENPVIRVMPNTPMAVGEGMAAVAAGKKATAEQMEAVLAIFRSAGKAIEIEEKLLDAVTGLSGSGPAYGFVMIDALADAGVKVGLPRAMAITLAAQTLLGAAKMVLDTGLHPAQLRDMVTSPGGTAITGVQTLERYSIRAALIDAVVAATKQSKDLGKKHE
ncbi:MAG: pyrroline-5-carboxylate reductase [Sporomusaceae bacterium]|nr:pyrroline-5-carboxylate reductase [Sporomusaceae bacterium]